MSSQKGRGESAESMRSSEPRTSANARSKHSTAKSQTVQARVTKEAKSLKGTQRSHHKWANPLAWFTTMGAMLGYGMYQHDNIVLFWVMILVTVGCGYGHAVEVLFKYLKLKAPTD